MLHMQNIIDIRFIKQFKRKIHQNYHSEIPSQTVYQ